MLKILYISKKSSNFAPQNCLKMIEVKNIHKSFGDLEVLKGVNLTVQKGEIVAIVGKSGAGKTTLLQIIGTLDQPTQGEVLINGERLMTKGEKTNI